MNGFIINYTPFRERLLETMNSFSKYQQFLSLEAVNCWDRENLSEDFTLSGNHDLWAKRIKSIAHILYSNAFQNNVNSTRDILKLQGEIIPEKYIWMKPRLLSSGEISVCMKHFYAISRIAQGTNSHGLIIEDDVRSTESNFNFIFDSLKHETIDYIDLAGGCKLTGLSDECSSESKSLYKLKIPRTRTTACYLVSQRLAKKLSEQFFPLVMPIDWHLQFIFSMNSQFEYYWSDSDALIHGSEHNIVTSWRNN